ncbi:MAG: hypothetical protein HGA61_02095 [Candidatus Moranbacteria bacterium]|nr:hypothetical protein [Candidatus Moranbacteria bacterium]
MPRSLINLIEAVAKNKKIKLNSSAWARIRIIERETKSRKTKPEGAVLRLKQEKELKGNLNEADWQNIKEQIEDIVD